MTTSSSTMMSRRRSASWPLLRSARCAGRFADPVVNPRPSFPESTVIPSIHAARRWRMPQAMQLPLPCSVAPQVHPQSCACTSIARFCAAFVLTPARGGPSCNTVVVQWGRGRGWQGYCTRSRKQPH